jgi:hypothetical protein
MSERVSPAIEELLEDSLVRAVMRADNVEPQALRTLLTDAALRVVVARIELKPGSELLTKPPIDRRTAPRAVSSPQRVRPTSAAEPCWLALCC